jgi:hypothetical protein
MRFLLFATLCLSAGSLFAQGSHGYAIVAPGSVNTGNDTTLHTVVGGEYITNIGVGIGGEAGYLFVPEFAGQGVGTASINGYYHLINRGRNRWDPFVTGGYSGFFRSGYQSLGNFGGGVNYWANDRLGFKVEFRDHVDAASRRTAHYWGFRFGITFR